eukprot:TRINITY_DN8757_c0_g1_i1.p1 TRINITY_DN8757_c0_g1~~TRINITY_DN8757_c0_g1_i1.p1  ORF type:complete len:906 (+),score=246.00 TRINITY_DN8757_c0_g1_i1:1-2718(+)
MMIKFVVVCAIIALAFAKWPAYTITDIDQPLYEDGDVPASFDCAMREYAWEFGKQLLPQYNQFESLFYALGLNDDCDVSMPDFTPADQSPEPPTFPSGDGDCVYYVDFNKGNDANEGTIDSPLKTVAIAVDQTSGRPACTINLREGTHYLDATVHLSTNHNGLTIQNYNGERAIVSGGKRLKVDWKPYTPPSRPTPTPTPPPGPTGWVEYNNVNYVYGAVIDNQTYTSYGKMDNYTQCQSACQQDTRCHAYTWHDANQGSYANDCIGRLDGHYNDHAQDGHYSGHDGSATPIGPSPSPAPPTNPINMYVADVSGQVDIVPGLQYNGRRVTRARYPNGNVETTIPDNRVPGGAANWQAPNLAEQGMQTYVEQDDPAKWRNFTHFGFQKYMVGIGGPCNIYHPPVSYWCSKDPSGGGAFAFRAPQGFWPKDATTLPNMPYADATKAIVNVWRPSRWANWMFEVNEYDPATGNVTFGKGGFQGARGNNQGSDFFIENVFEEFDYQNEYYFDEAKQLLYYFHNGTGSPDPDAEVVAPQLISLFNLTGDRFQPVSDVTIRGLTLTQARYTYMHPHGVPSGGDWALDRYAAVFLQGTSMTTVDQCNFTRLDGNAVMVSGYNRNATISNSEFSWIGGNAMAGWGFTNETTGNGLEGMDGTDGNHPRYTNIVGNLAREVGHYEKQSSFWFQGKVAQTYLHGNVFFNGPRAGINFNDGFGGGDELSRNLVFSTCRESGDHGPFNSWDRQPFITTVRTGQPSIQMQWREIHHNFMVDNYNPQEAIDNDDGSTMYHTHDNFLVYGSRGMKNDFGGNSNHHYNNVYAYIGEALGITSQDPGFEDYFYNNTVVMTGDNVGSFGCSGSGATVMHDNSYYSPDGNVSSCGNTPPKEPNVKVGKIPNDSTIIGWAKALLSA